MESIKIPNFQYTRKQIEAIARYFRQGKVVVYPTDTVYGIGCSATEPEPIDRIYEIKQRDRSKPLLILVSDLDMAEEYFKINREQKDHLKKYWPGPVSFLLDSKGKLAQNKKTGSVVRLPKNDFLTRMIKRVGRPITSTSFNISGEEVIKDPANSDFDPDALGVDLVVDAGPLAGNPSSIIDLRDINNIKTIRN